MSSLLERTPLLQYNKLYPNIGTLNEDMASPVNSSTS